MDRLIQVHWTCEDLKEARRVASGLIERRWVACVNIVPEVESIYRWEGKIEQAREVKVWLKTRYTLFAAVCDFIQKNSSYDLPEIVFTEIAGGNQAYLDWVSEETEPT